MGFIDRILRRKAVAHEERVLFDIDPLIRERATGWLQKYHPSDFENEIQREFYLNDLEERIFPTISQLLSKPTSMFSLDLFEKILDRREMTAYYQIGNWLGDFASFEDERDRALAEGRITVEQAELANKSLGEVAISQLTASLREEQSREWMRQKAESGKPATDSVVYLRNHNKHE